MTVPEGIELLEGKGTADEIADFLHKAGIRKPDLTDDNSPALSFCCPVATWLKKVTDEHILVGVTTVFVFNSDPILTEFPLPAAEYPIPPKIRDFILYLEYYTRSWETRTKNAPPVVKADNENGDSGQGET